MARERDRAEWNRISHLIATLENVNKVKGKPTKAEDRTPYGQNGNPGKGVPLRKDNINILRSFVKGQKR